MAVVRLKALNPSPAYSDADLTLIARQCLAAANAAGIALTNCGRRWLPIFVTGEQNPSGVRTQEAAQHDLDALTVFPAWFVLHAEKSDVKTGDPDWYTKIDPDPCPTREKGIRECDEFPFRATEEGGEFGKRRTGMQPDLRVISASANSGQGGMLVSFYRMTGSGCAMRSGTPQGSGENARGGDPYLAIAIPTGMTSGWLCNGKNAADQPSQPFPW